MNVSQCVVDESMRLFAVDNQFKAVTFQILIIS